MLLASVEQMADEPRDDGEFLPFTYGAHRLAASLLEPAVPGAQALLCSYPIADAQAMAADFARHQPDILALSAYVWSAPVLLQAAQLHKARFPHATVVIGGPSARPIMVDHPAWQGFSGAIDALVAGEGEEVLRDIVLLPARGPDQLAQIAGVQVPVYTHGRRSWRQGPPCTAGPLDAMPSPHQLAIVPPRRTAHLETFRGCPLACAFCEWGVAGPPSRVFGVDYLVRELRAYQQTGALGAFLVDAGLNLNRRGLHNLIAAEREVGFFADHPLSTEIYAGWLRDEELQFLGRVRCGRLGVGLQSAEPEVLRRMGRPHDNARFLHGVQRLAEVATPVIEIMVGLPFDSPAGFWRTLDWARRLPGSEVHVFWTLVLPDGLMSRAPDGAQCAFDPFSLRMLSCTGWPAQDLASTVGRLGQEARAAGGVASDNYWTFPILGRRAA